MLTENLPYLTNAKFHFSMNQYTEGTSSQPITFTSTSGSSAGSWGSIILSGSGANNSVIKYVTMKYGTNVQANNTSNITIENSTFTDNEGAIKFSNSTGSIISNSIAYTADHHAIDLESASNVSCNLNTITKTETPHDYNDVAILFGGGSSGWVGGNDMDYFNWGIGTIWGSSPNFGNTPHSYSRNNRVTNCSDGIVIYHDSYPDMYDADNCWGDNSIHGNSVDISLNYLSNVNSYYLDALQDYWNNGNPLQMQFSKSVPVRQYTQRGILQVTHGLEYHFQQWYSKAKKLMDLFLCKAV
jgi:Right handed beta helix region